MYRIMVGNVIFYLTNSFTWCSVALIGKSSRTAGRMITQTIRPEMESCNCECDAINVEMVNFEQEEISKGFSDESSETNEKHDDESRKRKRRKKRMLTGVSRQRRAANARERRRIQGVNRAFVQLKNTLPLAQIDISKIEILRLAVKWIDHLRTLLKDYDERKELLNTKQLQTSRPNEFVSLEDDMAPVKHDCLYHQFPDLKNTLWEECIGLDGKYMVILFFIVLLYFLKTCMLNIL